MTRRAGHVRTWEKNIQRRGKSKKRLSGRIESGALRGQQEVTMGRIGEQGQATKGFVNQGKCLALILSALGRLKSAMVDSPPEIPTCIPKTCECVT